MRDLANLFLDAPGSTGGRATQIIASGQLTAWDPPTGQNTVQVDNVTYTNLPLVDPDQMVAGDRVLLLFPPGGGVPILVGRLFTPTP